MREGERVCTLARACGFVREAPKSLDVCGGRTEVKRRRFLQGFSGSVTYGDWVSVINGKVIESSLTQ